MFAFTTKLETTTCAGQLAIYTFYYIIFASTAFHNPTVFGYYCRFYKPKRVGHFLKLAFGSTKSILGLHHLKYIAAGSDIPMHVFLVVTQQVHMVWIMAAFSCFLKKLHVSWRTSG
jgi:hypothetical protein